MTSVSLQCSFKGSHSGWESCRENAGDPPSVTAAPAGRFCFFFFWFNPSSVHLLFCERAYKPFALLCAKLSLISAHVVRMELDQWGRAQCPLSLFLLHYLSFYFHYHLLRPQGCSGCGWYIWASWTSSDQDCTNEQLAIAERISAFFEGPGFEQHSF